MQESHTHSHMTQERRVLRDKTNREEGQPEDLKTLKTIEIGTDERKVVNDRKSQHLWGSGCVWGNLNAKLTGRDLQLDTPGARVSCRHRDPACPRQAFWLLTPPQRRDSELGLQLLPDLLKTRTGSEARMGGGGRSIAPITLSVNVLLSVI